MEVKKAILPVAGLGTRVMPLTLHQPKGMIGVVDRPIIHYVIDEILAAGIKHIIIVRSPNQHQFKKYLDYLKKNDPEWQKLNLKFDFIVQKGPYGNGDAVFKARKIIGEEPFLVCFGDDILTDKKPPLKTVVELFNKTRSPIVMLERVSKKMVSRYGVVKAKKSSVAKNFYEISDVVEKPKPEEAPSNLTIIGRYVLTLEIVKHIAKLYPYQGREIWLADALKNYILGGGKLYGWQFTGHRFDGGSKLGILKAQAYFGVNHKELGPEFRKYLRTIK